MRRRKHSQGGLPGWAKFVIGGVVVLLVMGAWNMFTGSTNTAGTSASLRHQDTTQYDDAPRVKRGAQHVIHNPKAEARPSRWKPRQTFLPSPGQTNLHSAAVWVRTVGEEPVEHRLALTLCETTHEGARSKFHCLQRLTVMEVTRTVGSGAFELVSFVPAGGVPVALEPQKRYLLRLEAHPLGGVRDTLYRGIGWKFERNNEYKEGHGAVLQPGELQFRHMEEDSHDYAFVTYYREDWNAHEDDEA